MTPAAVKFADAAPFTKDKLRETCARRTGAPAILRQPEHLHITWEDDRTLRLDTDTGTQTRVFHFGDWKAPAGPPTLQEIRRAVGNGASGARFSAAWISEVNTSIRI